MRPLSPLVDVSPRYRRAVNLAASSAAASGLDGYIVTPNVGQALRRVVRGIQVPGSSRAFTLYGPYGSGKSSFSVFLAQLLSRDDALSGKALSLLGDAGLAEECRRARGGGFLTVAVTARRQAAGLVLCEGVRDALGALPPSDGVAALRGKAEGIVRDGAWRDSAATLGLLGALPDLALSLGLAGVLLVVDEAGKTLEYALQDAGGGDVYLFQQVAELANHLDAPLVFVVSLHQLFDEYVELADRTLRAEWDKVQERFAPVPFGESDAATMRMIAAAVRHPRGVPADAGRRVAEETARLAAAGVRLPLGLDAASFAALALDAWPIHPLSLLVMPQLFRTLGQNERSIFTWLCGDEPCAFRQHLRSADADEDAGFVRLHDLHAFLAANLAGSLAHRPRGRSLAEAEEAVRSRPGLDRESARVLASVGILGVPGLVSSLGGSGRALLLCAMPDPAAAEERIRGLLRDSVIVHRRLDDSYRIWEGSDVDLQERLEEARRHVKGDGAALVSDLRRLLPPRRVVARRHAFQRGVYRYLDVVHVPDLSGLPAPGRTEAAGLVAVLLPLRGADALAAEATEATSRRDDLVVAVPRRMDVMLNLVEELSCLRWAADNTPELRDDRVARRELDLHAQQIVA